MPSRKRRVKENNIDLCTIIVLKIVTGIDTSPELSVFFTNNVSRGLSISMKI